MSMAAPDERPGPGPKQGMVLDKVVLLGRTLDEYRRYFAFDPGSLRGQRILDIASGVSSFTAEATAMGLDVTAFDAIYGLAPEVIEPRCVRDLDHVVAAVVGLKTYRWGFYESPERLRGFRERSYRRFLEDYRTAPTGRYVEGLLPCLPFESRRFDLTLVSYLLMVYEDHFSYEFHRDSVLELMRVTRGEARIYPVVTFEAQICRYIEQFKHDPALNGLVFDEVMTDFEFLVGSNRYLRIRHASS